MLTFLDYNGGITIEGEVKQWGFRGSSLRKVCIDGGVDGITRWPGKRGFFGRKFENKEKRAVMDLDMKINDESCWGQFWMVG